MQVTVEDKSSVKKILHIEVPESEVTNQLDAAYKQLKKTAKVKGFRPGKTPRSILERMFKKDVHMDVTSRLIQDSLIEAIKEEDIATLFDPFTQIASDVQSTVKGTGLGLAISKHIVENIHKGRIWAESKHEEGSCFFVELSKNIRDDACNL